MNDDDLTTDLGRELHGRSDAMHGSSLALADVKLKARSIRRRRAATAVGGAVAAVALIVPTAALASHQGHRASPLPPATQSVTPSPSATDGQQPPAGVLDVSDLPTGAPPAMDYVYRGRPAFRRRQHRRRAYPIRARPVRRAGRRVARLADHPPRHAVRRDPGPRRNLPRPGPERLAASASTGRTASWPGSTTSGQVMIWEGWASQPRPLGDPVPGSDLRLGPLTGDGEAAPGQAGPDCAATTCTVIVNNRGDWQPWEVSESGSQPLLDGGYLERQRHERGRSVDRADQDHRRRLVLEAARRR